jgi:hypothetical protein
MSGFRKKVARRRAAVVLALLTVGVVLVVAGSAFPAGRSVTWEWESQSGPLASTVSGSDVITLDAEIASNEGTALAVKSDGNVLQEVQPSGEDQDAIIAFSVTDSSGTRAVTGVARSDVAHLSFTLDGGSAQDLPFTAVGAFAIGNLPAGASVALQAAASDGSTIENVTLPQTSPACVGVVSCEDETAAAPRAAALSTSPTTAYAIVETRAKHELTGKQTGSGESWVTRDAVTRIDPTTLKPIGRLLFLVSRSIPPAIGAVALSPDQKRLAFAGTEGGTISIVDLGSMRVTRRIHTRSSVVVRSLAWLDNDQLALIAQQMSKPYNRDVVGRWLIRVHVARGTSVAMSVTKKATIEYSQRAGSRLITVLRPNSFRDPTRTIVVSDADNRTFFFPVTLPAPSPKLVEDRSIASPDGKHIYVLRSGGQVVDIDIDTQSMSLHKVAAPADAPTTTPIGSALLADATPQGLVTSDFFTFNRAGGIAYRSGVYLIDTSNWTAKTLDPDSRDFVVYGDKVATFNFASPAIHRATSRPLRGAGVNVFDAASGQRLYHLYGTRVFAGVVMIGDSGHALGAPIRGAFPFVFLDSRFNLVSGKAVTQSRAPLGEVRLIYRGSQTIGESGAEAASTMRSVQSATAISATPAATAVPHAFARPATALDALPAKASFRRGIPTQGGPPQKILATRRIASYTDGRGRRALLYLLRTGAQICEFTFWRDGAGGGCNPKSDFFAARHVVAGSGHLIAGVVDETVARLVIVGTHGGRHYVTPTADGGFIYDCRAYSGCTGCVIDHLEAFNAAGQRIEADRVTGGCTKNRNR